MLIWEEKQGAEWAKVQTGSGHGLLLTGVAWTRRRRCGGGCSPSKLMLPKAHAAMPQQAATPTGEMALPGAGSGHAQATVC